MGVRPLMPRRAVFLDRDGVVNEAVVREGKPYPPQSPQQLRLVEGAREALALLHERGLLLVVVTNQPDVARGDASRQSVEHIHSTLAGMLPLDDFFVCYHDDPDGCHCRKPKPGLLLDAAARHEISLPDSFLIGDRWRDIDAAHAAGCRSVLLDYGYDERGPTREPDVRVSTLAQAADWILSRLGSAPTP